MPGRPSPLAEPVIVAEWRKTGGADVIRLILKTYEGHEILDLRTWRNDFDGECRPLKGFACGIQHLPQIAKAISAALHKARELGLIEGGP